MAVLQVLHIPDERLRKVAEPVKEVNAEIQRIVDDMFETMYAEEGIGLAATQVDIHQRIIVIDVSENREEQLVLINPELLEKDGETGIEEGCLSIPEQRALVPRAEKVKIRALDRDGKPFELKPTACWLSVFSMRWITWSANCLSIICRRSNNSVFVRKLRNWIVCVRVPEDKE
jgi:peptide deformylase